MKAYCLVCRKNTYNVNSKMIKSKNARLQFKSQCSICEKKKSRFVSKTRSNRNFIFSRDYNTFIKNTRSKYFHLNIKEQEQSQHHN